MNFQTGSLKRNYLIILTVLILLSSLFIYFQIKRRKSVTAKINF